MSKGNFTLTKTEERSLLSLNLQDIDAVSLWISNFYLKRAKKNGEELTEKQWIKILSKTKPLIKAYKMQQKTK